MAVEDAAVLSDEVERYRRLCAAFDALRPLDGAARTDALRTWSSSQPAEFVAELQAMLQAAEGRGLDPTPAVLPVRFGAVGSERGYRVLRELGRGGMGRVLLAERADGRFDRQVAIKLLERSPHDAGWRRRFAAERAILSRLLHPNIARLLDAGESADGTPYLVIEYIDGVTLDTWLKRDNPDLSARIGVFEAIARGVAHAHQSLVAHRDLKPGNVLIDAKGEPHLLDFGIARLLSDDATATETGLHALTPRYAAPEQIDGSATGAAVDIWQLGVLLCELLSGQTPFANLTGSSLLNAIVHKDPPPPSQLASSEQPALPWRGQLQGDLDAIVAMALRRDPQQRYRSVEALLGDVQRWRDGLPVLARRGGRWYRACKFIRRHRLSLAAGFALLLLTTGFIARLQQELQRSEREQATAKQATELMIAVLGEADPRKARGRELTLREALDQGVERIRAEADLPDAVRGRLLHALGVVYSQLSDLARAEALLLEALPLRERAGEGLDATNTAYSLAVLRQRQGRIEDAQAMLQHTIELLNQADPNDRRFLAELHNGSAILSRARGDSAAARIHFEQAVALLRSDGPEAQEDLGPTLRNFAELTDDLGEHAAALRLIDEAQKHVDRWYPGDDPEQSRLLRVRARNALFRDDRAAGAALLADAWAMTERLYSGDHDERVRVADLLAQERWAAGDAARAKQLLRDAVAAGDRLYPNGHERLYGIQLRLAALGWVDGELDSVRVLLDQAERSHRADALRAADRKAEQLLQALLTCDPAAIDAARDALLAEPSLPPWLRSAWQALPGRCRSH